MRTHYEIGIRAMQVSMKSGLEDRNNLGLNVWTGQVVCVSMKSGLEDRNNSPSSWPRRRNVMNSLNEVRPGRPEQW